MTSPQPAPASSPHVHAAALVAAVMRQVLLALLPGIAFYLYWFGCGVLVQVAVATAAGLTCEAAMLVLRRQPLAPFLRDGSVCVTAVLLALAMPPLAPWWLAVIGMAFAVIVAKHAYGGLGRNLFNPAMAGYALLLLCFPVAMKVWPVAGAAPGLSETLALIFGDGNGDAGIDAYSGATALEFMRAQLRGMKMISELGGAPAFGGLGARGWEWVSAGYLLGGAWLLWRRIIRWQIPAGVLGALFVTAFLFHATDADRYPPPLFHLFSGAAVLGAFFIATDPVSSPTTPRGRLLFGVAVGVVVYLIRTFGSYPDGVAFAVLIMNGASPLIERYTRPRILGAQRR